MWRNFDRTAYSRDEFAQHVAALTWSAWRPEGVTLHNTAAPTLKQWAESGPAHDARIANLESYYENELGWHAGPHLFISRTKINGFSDILRPGVHSRCFNATRIGIEMVGDYNAEQFNSGDGALVRDNAVFAMAVLHNKLRLDPDKLVFHVECKQDNHDCPGRLVVKSDVIARVKALMATLTGKPVASPAAGSVQGPPVKRMTGITATEFAGKDDNFTMLSAYDGKNIGAGELAVSLPARVPESQRKVRVFLGHLSALCTVRDVGPWNRHDDYWNKSGRPSAEYEYDNKQRAENGRVPSNRAGIDLTPAVFVALGAAARGMITVDWRFE